MYGVKVVEQAPNIAKIHTKCGMGIHRQNPFPFLILIFLYVDLGLGVLFGVKPVLRSSTNQRNAAITVLLGLLINLSTDHVPWDGIAHTPAPHVQALPILTSNQKKERNRSVSSLLIILIILYILMLLKLFTLIIYSGNIYVYYKYNILLRPYVKNFKLEKVYVSVFIFSEKVNTLMSNSLSQHGSSKEEKYN